MDNGTAYWLQVLKHAYLFVSPIILYSVSDGLVFVTLSLAFAAIAACVLLAEFRNIRVSDITHALPARLLATSLLLLSLLWVVLTTKDPWYTRWSIEPVATACAAVLIYTVCSIKYNTGPQVVRALAANMLIGVATIASIFILQELSTILETGLTPYESTLRPCNTTYTSDGFVYQSVRFSASCPTEVWELLRDNIIFIIQVHSLYVLTTDTWASSDQTVKLSVLAAVEAVLWSAAAVFQFNYLEGCYLMKVETMVCICLAVTASFARTAAKSSSRSNHAIGYDMPIYHRKLKL